MDSEKHLKKYLTEQIKKCRNRMNLAKLIDCGILAAAAGGVGGMLCELLSLLWPFYHVHLAAGLCFAAGFAAGSCCAVCRRASMSQAARRLDSFGLKERMITAYELLDAQEELAVMQRQDALLHYDQMRDRIRIPLWPDKRHVLALLLSAALVVVLGILPSPVRAQAGLRHQVQEQAREELEELGELVEALEGVDMDSLTQEQRAQFQELIEALQRSQEELIRADTWESLGSATERLDYKYGQTQQSLERLAAQLENPAAAGVASAQELARAANPNGMQSSPGSSAVASSQNGSGNQGMGEGDGSSTGNQGNGDGSGGQMQGDGSGSGQGDGSGQRDSSGSGGVGDDGEGGSGSGGSEGGQGGQGSGDGPGSGGGSGRGTGSSSALHDYVSIPNGVGDDASLTGEKYGDQNSDYFRQQNGLAWEGEHVDYSSVLGQYTDSAYEGIAGGRYPTGMEAVIRDYFENLNK